jgi:hypothetical protein
MAFLLAKPRPLNVNHGNDRFSMFNKKRDIALLVRCVSCNRIETRPRDKAIKPLLAAAQELRPRRGAHNPTPLDAHYDALRAAMRRVFHELGIAA